MFEDDDVTHVEGEVNPVRDLEIISEELRLKVNRNSRMYMYEWTAILIIVIYTVNPRGVLGSTFAGYVPLPLRTPAPL